MILRNAVLSDLDEIKTLFTETIKSVCKNDYNPEQINAWVSGVKNTERWINVLEKQFILLAIIEKQIVGYGTLKDGNYLDFFFIHKDFQRQGIAQKILNALEMEAKNRHSEIITSDVSITAKGFFEKNGFLVKAEQKNIVLNVEIIKYKMEKKLV